MPHSDAHKIYSCGKHDKRTNCLLQAISPFLTMFCPLCDTYFFILNALYNIVCKLFLFGPTEILSSGKRLTDVIIIIIGMIVIWTYRQSRYFNLTFSFLHSSRRLHSPTVACIRIKFIGLFVHAFQSRKKDIYAIDINYNTTYVYLALYKIWPWKSLG